MVCMILVPFWSPTEIIAEAHQPCRKTSASSRPTRENSEDFGVVDADVSASGRLCVSVRPAFAAAQRCRCGRRCLALAALLIVQERGDLPDVVVDEQQRDDDLRSAHSSDAAAAGGFDVFVAGCLQLLVLSDSTVFRACWWNFSHSSVP